MPVMEIPLRDLFDTVSCVTGQFIIEKIAEICYTEYGDGNGESKNH